MEELTWWRLPKRFASDAKTRLRTRLIDLTPREPNDLVVRVRRVMVGDDGCAFEIGLSLLRGQQTVCAEGTGRDLAASWLYLAVLGGDNLRGRQAEAATLLLGDVNEARDRRRLVRVPTAPGERAAAGGDAAAEPAIARSGTMRGGGPAVRGIRAEQLPTTGRLEDRQVLAVYQNLVGGCRWLAGHPTLTGSPRRCRLSSRWRRRSPPTCRMTWRCGLSPRRLTATCGWWCAWARGGEGADRPAAGGPPGPGLRYARGGWGQRCPASAGHGPWLGEGALGIISSHSVRWRRSLIRPTSQAPSAPAGKTRGLGPTGRSSRRHNGLQRGPAARRRPGISAA